MNDTPDLIQKYLNGTIAVDEHAALDRLLAADPVVADALARASAIDAALADHFAMQSEAARSSTLAYRAVQALHGGDDYIPERRPGRRSISTMAASLAVTVALVVGFIVLVQLRDQTVPQGGTALLTGRVLVDGEADRPIRDGANVQVLEEALVRMLGSTSIELTVQENGTSKVIVFSGDLGPYDQPIVRPFEQLPYADIVFLESTYGNRNHRPYAETMKEFEEIILKAVEQKGKILIPTFAIGRAQQMLYHLAILFFQKKVPPFPVFVDSPMAIEAGKVFAQHPDLFDEEATDWKKQGLLPLDRTWFKFITSVEESKQLNDLNGPCAILAGAGMCNGGRIQHHLKFNLPHPTTHVLIVGYQGYGSLGRQLVDGAKQVKILRETIDVRATVHTLNGLSAHAGQNDLLKWFSSLGKAKPKVILTHGENPQREALASQIEKSYGLKPLLPQLNEIVEIE